MKKHKSSRTVVPPGFFPKLLLPFAIPICLTLVLAITVGDNWPRNIAPGSGLKLAGLLASGVTALSAWLVATRHIADRRAHQMAALVCAMTGLMGWPVWSVGIMPRLNGIRLGPEQPVRMILERTEDTTVSRSRRRDHWAWLQPASPGGAAGAGRYFIPEAIFRRWNEAKPATVTVTIAEGLLGARVVTRFE